MEAMMGLTKWRATRAWQVIGIWAALSSALLPMGCSDTTNNADSETPVAVTANGVRIVRVERNEAARTITADLERTGESRTVVFGPLEAGPFPTGLTASVDGSDTDGFQVLLSWDEASGTVWMRQQTATDVLEVVRSVRAGRVHESCELNGTRVDLDYPEMTDGQLDKAVARWRRGDLGLAPPEIAALGSSFAALDELSAQYAASSLASNANRELLASVWDDAAFAGAISGGSVDPLRSKGLAGSLCRWLGLCSAFSCRFFPPACEFCAAGVVACLIIDLACEVIGCDCCF